METENDDTQKDVASKIQVPILGALGVATLLSGFGSIYVIIGAAVGFSVGMYGVVREARSIEKKRRHEHTH